ncbi:hypothetical protein FISHEDRAFT_58169 [Fistulina hepatica ATCC 64428]|nr:hypothetical protein FISHEDRAFT_58169 [Fistulina hepatica ATCC 64428]
MALFRDNAVRSTVAAVIAVTVAHSLATSLTSGACRLKDEFEGKLKSKNFLKLPSLDSTFRSEVKQLASSDWYLLVYNVVYEGPTYNGRKCSKGSSSRVRRQQVCDIPSREVRQADSALDRVSLNNGH